MAEAKQRAALSRRAVLEAAMTLADEGGLAAVSMRAVASRLGVTPMALYSYVPDKEALLDGLVERLLDEVKAPLAEQSWHDRVRAMASRAREAARRHPAVFPLLLARPVVTPASLRVVEAVFGALLEAGVPDRDIPRVERLISTFVLGFAASEAGGRLGPGAMPPAARRSQAEAVDLPLHHKLAKFLDASGNWDIEFDEDIADLIRLIESYREEGRAARPTSHSAATK